MKSTSLQLILEPLIGVLICVTAMQYPSAIAFSKPTPVVAQYAANAVSVAGNEDAGRIGIYIERWSTDDELDRLRAALAQGDADTLLHLFGQQRLRAGVVLLPGVQGHGARVRERTPKNVLFARAYETPAGRRLILVSDERLGLGDSQIEARKEVYEFNLLDIRFAPDGKGVGKVATAAGGVYNPATRSLEIKDYESQAARLVDVKVETPRRAEALNAMAR